MDLQNGIETMTTEKWKNQFAVSFETARRDLTWLAQKGYLAARTSGHKKYFDVIRE